MIIIYDDDENNGSPFFSVFSQGFQRARHDVLKHLVLFTKRQKKQQKSSKIKIRNTC